MRRFRTVMITCMLALVALGAQAQSWPAKPVRFIVPFGPGVSPDIVGRLIAERMAKLLGQPVVVDNVAGAAGIIGAQALARAPADGYTVMLAPGGTLVNNAFLFKSLPYDPVRDFMPVAMIADSGPFAITVSADVPATSLQEFIALARSQPGRLSYGVETSSSVTSIIGRLLNKRAGIDTVQVPYKTTAQVLQDLVAGRIHYTIGTPASSDGLVKAGKVRRIAVTSTRRFETLPDVPSVAETFPGFRMEGTMVLLVPAATPGEIVQRLNRTVEAALKEGDVRARMLQLGVSTGGAGTPESTAEFIRNERALWRDIVSELNIQPE
jgi:tripartite-type tricarboxylate transporter receptor subunit TctC